MSTASRDSEPPAGGAGDPSGASRPLEERLLKALEDSGPGPGATRTTPVDLLLGRIAVEWGLVDMAALEEALREQEASRAEGRERPLGRILLDRGRLKAEDLARLQEEQERRTRAFPEIPRYQIRERLGEGATAVVYRAWDREVGRPVALKVLREAAGLSEVSRQRFRREAQAAGGLSHPNVAAVYDAGEAGGLLYLALELVEGRSLADLLREGKMGERDLLGILEKAARGVAAAHAKGVVHRDLKPANILVTALGEPKVGDLGLAHLADSSVELTKTGCTLGTPLYMSPEQVQGRAKDATPATDVYALGAILYEVSAGRPPHAGDTTLEIYARILRDEPVPPRSLNSRISHDLETIILYERDATYEELLRRVEKARIPVEEAVVRAPRLAAGHFLLGRGRELEGDEDGAEACLRRALELDPGLTPARYQLGRLLLGRICRATIGTSAEERESRRPEAGRLAREAAGQIERAVSAGAAADCGEALKIHPGFADAFYNRGVARYRLGDLEGAVGDFTAALGLDPGHAHALVNRGITRSDLGRLEEALADFDRALALGPRGTPAPYNRGIALVRAGRLDEALLDFEETLRIDPRHAGALAMRGFVRARKGDAEGALEDLGRVIRIRPSWAAPYVVRAQVRWAEGDRRGAVADARKALELGVEGEDRAEMDRILGRVREDL